MRTVFEASNTVEAHMLLDLLRQEGMMAHIDGEYLQGAIGGLPAMGLVKVQVDETDYVAAKALVDKWDADQPEYPRAYGPPASSTLFGVFAIGLVVGLLSMYAFFRAPVAVNGADHKGNGVLDDKWTYAPNGQPVTNEVDRNLDGKVDYIAHFGERGAIEFAEADDNFDGVFESRFQFKSGNLEMAEVDTDGDGFRDLRTNYVHGVAVSTEYIYPPTGLPQKIEYFKLGKITYSDSDTDKDGKMDTRTIYNEIGDVADTYEIR
jgi:hypothetical protein